MRFTVNSDQTAEAPKEIGLTIASILAVIPSWDAVGRLVPPARGSKDGPGGSRHECWIGALYHCMMCRVFREHALYDWNDGTFKGHLRQLARTAHGLRKIVADS